MLKSTRGCFIKRVFHNKGASWFQVSFATEIALKMTKSEEFISKEMTVGELKEGSYHHPISGQTDFTTSKNKKDKKLNKIFIATEALRGTRDFFPEDMRIQRWLFDAWRCISSKYGFSEYDAPILEYDSLYKRKGGEDIVQQMYNFIDKDGCEITLRPEMTPSLARMILSKSKTGSGVASSSSAMTSRVPSTIQLADILPLKWFSIPQCWRFETTQRGRKREHYQWNMDIVGVPGIFAEFELLSAMVDFFKLVGLTSTNVGIKINSRELLRNIIASTGSEEEKFPTTCVIIDKMDKIGSNAVIELLEKETGMTYDAASRIVKFVECRTIDEFMEHCELHGACCQNDSFKRSMDDISCIFKMAESCEFSEWLVFDPSVVRGLSYYTGIVWEAFDRRGILRAIAGGGRYDKLLSLYGSPTDMPCVGFGFGDCVIMELLSDLKLLPTSTPQVDYVVAAYKGMYNEAVSVAGMIRRGGASVDMFMQESRKVALQFKYADKVGARRMVLVAPSEWEKGMVRIKDLRSGEQDNRSQIDVSFENLGDIDRLFSELESP